ncbi:hypothetical protein PP707_07885, partial [Acetobacter pasteurianus]|nr:hypothetical protein [Acetobacter pasteurianus]
AKESEIASATVSDYTVTETAVVKEEEEKEDKEEAAEEQEKIDEEKQSTLFTTTEITSLVTEMESGSTMAYSTAAVTDVLEVFEGSAGYISKSSWTVLIGFIGYCFI